MKRIGFVVKEENETAAELAEELARGLAALGAERVHDNYDLAVVLGGDGTMLRASRIVGDSATPVLGINLGHLGFLAPFEPGAALETIRSAIAGDLPLTTRMRLHIALERSDGSTESWVALNDAVVHQGAVARLLELDAFLDDAFIACYRADGLIVASPTGSTAYNLAAGGPILLPEQRAMAVTPICAHALTMRPFVASAESRLVIVSGSLNIHGAITIDGYWSETINPGDRLVITEANTPLQVFRAPGQSYFDILRNKMHWGVREAGSR